MAGAWEQNNSVLCAILHTDATSVAWALGLRNLIIPGGVMALAGMPFDHARNAACMRMLEVGATWLFFLDSDVIPGRDAVIRLMSHNKPLISGIYARRSPPHGVPVMIKNGQWLTNYPKDRLFEVDVVGAGCLLPDTEVLTNFAPVNAMDIENHRVLTGMGRYRRIVAKKSRAYSGEVISLSSTSFRPPTWLTPEHPVFIIPKKWVEWCKPDSPLAASLIEQFGQYAKAGEIREGDYLATPIFRDVNEIKYIRLSDHLGDEKIEFHGDDICYKTSRHPVTGELVKYRNVVTVDDDFLEFCGYYLAEGSAGKELAIHLGAHEKSLIERVIELTAKCFGVEASTRTPRGGSISIRIGGKILGQFFRRNFGESSDTKRIPQWMMALPPKMQLSLLKGLVLGDGCVVRGRGFSAWVTYATVSKTLARQVQQLYLRNGLIVTVRMTTPQKSKFCTSLNREIRGRFPVWHANLYARNAWWFITKVLGEEVNVPHSSKWQRSFIVDGILYSKATIRKKEYSGDVYDFQVDGDSTYVAGNFLVHNCLLIHRDVISRMQPQRPGKHWFDWRVDMKGLLPPGECLSEDFTFCCAVKKQLGIPTLIDPGVVCRHVGLAQSLPGRFEPCDTTPET